jgi:hypothetical protein
MKRLMVAALALVMSSAMWVAAQMQQTKPATPATPAKPAPEATATQQESAAKPHKAKKHAKRHKKESSKPSSEQPK